MFPLLKPTWIDTLNASPPSVHSMVVTLEKRGFIRRTLGASRSIQLLLTRDMLPDLE
jgi:DNA-binding MarR family transcriptional regulator